MNPASRDSIVRRLAFALLGFASCSLIAGLTPEMLHRFGAATVFAAPPSAIVLLFVRRKLDRPVLRAMLLGLSIGLLLVFAYGFSPPVLERIGHAAGWPGRSLRYWERFTAPVYDDCCRSAWFWHIFEVWDICTTMIAARLEESPLAVSLGVVLPLATIVAVLRWMRSGRAFEKA